MKLRSVGISLIVLLVAAAAAGEDEA